MASICWLGSDILLGHGMKERGRLAAEEHERRIAWQFSIGRNVRLSKAYRAR
jgi:hypothetical protein